MKERIIKEKVKERYSEMLVKKCGCGGSCCESTGRLMETAGELVIPKRT